MNLRDTAIAFQAILLYNHYKNWGFTYQTTHGVQLIIRIYARNWKSGVNYVLQEVPKYNTQSGENGIQYQQ